MKVYVEDKPEKKEIAFMLKERKMLAVDAHTGERVACLVNLSTMQTERGARGAIEDEGYPTGFAKWDEEGRMIKLLEDFE